MTVLGNLKRIARRPSLLMKAPAKASPLPVSDTDSELGSFESKEESRNSTISSSTQKQSKRRETKYTPPPSVQDFMREYVKSKSEEMPRPRPRNRRASTGGGSSGSFALPPTSRSDIPLITELSDEQRARIRRAKARRRNSTHAAIPKDDSSGICEKVTPEKVIPGKGQRTAQARRHSLDYGTLQPLYKIRPTNDPAPFKTETTIQKDVHKKLSLPCRRNSLSDVPQDSMRSLETTKTSGSHGTQLSGGSTFSSTGWSIASLSPRKKRAPPILNHPHINDHGALGGLSALGVHSTVAGRSGP